VGSVRLFLLHVRSIDARWSEFCWFEIDIYHFRMKCGDWARAFYETLDSYSSSCSGYHSHQHWSLNLHKSFIIVVHSIDWTQNT
jgi:hypothetical protein